MNGWDTREVREVAVDLSRAPGRIQRNAGTVMRRFASRVARGMTAHASGHRYLPQLPSTVSAGQIGPLRHEVGFEKRGQGKLAHIIVDGSVNNAPVFDHTASVRIELPRTADALADEGEDAALGGPR
jgi:hypothetical protein